MYSPLFLTIALVLQTPFLSIASIVKRDIICGQRHRDAPGTLNSPNYPEEYPASTDCSWTISTTAGKIITLKFTKFSLEAHPDCSYDYVKVYDGESDDDELIGEYCGSNIPEKLVSSNSKMHIVFHSDSGVEARGFSMKFSSSYGCDHYLTENSGEILSPNFPAIHPQPTQCNYLINVTTGSTINLTFVEFDLEKGRGNDCQYDYIEVFDGPSPHSTKLGKFCGNVKPKVKRTSGHVMLIRFYADATISKTGFRIKYYAKEKEVVISDVCSRPKYTGDCRAGFDRWFYNAATKRCERFIYGGCNSNGNNFETKRECLKRCHETSHDFNECSRENGGCDQSCHNTLGSYFCSCWKGYRLGDDQHTCEDLDECLQGRDVHHCQQNCTNMPGSYYCTCQNGFILSANRRTCIDINECVTGGTRLCRQDCINLPGTYQCSCYDGYESYPGRPKECKDINECEKDLDDCHNCTNTDGSYECTCRPGFALSEDKKSCSDIDECLIDNGGCSQICINTPGSFECKCQDGFYSLDIASINCQDIDECIDNNGNCSHECLNSMGSFNCSCPRGYALKDEHICLDINECITAPCSHNCSNTNGSFFCFCEEGFHISDDRVTCVDTNECEGNSSCDQICINNNGSYTCECHDGYRLLDDQMSCVDIDECLEETSCCDTKCVNEDGGYSCSCNDGHFLSKDNCTCKDTNECLLNNGGCDHLCNNTKGGFSCSCHPGYQLDPTNSSRCIDINECLVENGGCSQLCNNTMGGYECHCRVMYDLDSDGKTCRHCPTCETFGSAVKIIEELQAEVKALQRRFSQLTLKNDECMYKGKTYKNRDNWDDGECRRCYCQNGQVLCFQEKDCFQADSPALYPAVDSSSNQKK